MMEECIIYTDRPLTRHHTTRYAAYSTERRGTCATINWLRGTAKLHRTQNYWKSCSVSSSRQILFSHPFSMIYVASKSQAKKSGVTTRRQSRISKGSCFRSKRATTLNKTQERSTCCSKLKNVEHTGSFVASKHASGLTYERSPQAS